MVQRIKLDAEEYAKAAVNAHEYRKQTRTEYAATVRDAGFDIHKTVAEMEEIYKG